MRADIAGSTCLYLGAISQTLSLIIDLVQPEWKTVSSQMFLTQQKWSDFCMNVSGCQF